MKYDSLGATAEFSSFNRLPNGLDGEYVMHQIIYSMKKVISTRNKDLEDYLAETFVKATKEICYTSFASQDRLCQELLLLVDIVDNPEGRLLFISYVCASPFPFLAVFCAFLDKCLTSEQFLIHYIVAHMYNAINMCTPA